MSLETKPNQFDTMPDDELLRAYNQAQKEVAQLIAEKDPKGTPFAMTLSEVFSNIGNRDYLKNIKEAYGSELSEKFTLLNEYHHALDKKGLKATTMEDKGI